MKSNLKSKFNYNQAIMILSIISIILSVTAMLAMWIKAT